MNNVWYKALMATPPVIYGRRLKPFSLCHSLALRELRSPILIGGKVSIHDVYLAAEVCRRNCRELRRDLFKIFSRKARLRWLLRWFGIIGKTPIAIESLRQYISDFADSPVHVQTEKQSENFRKLATPYEYVLHKNLCDYGYNPESAWDVSVSMAKCLYDVKQEQDGDTTLHPQWKVENDILFAKANDLLKEGKKEEAEKLFAECQRVIEENK